MVTFKKVTGFVLIDKPAGITSRKAVDRLEERFGVVKSGHTGTLDFGVTGLLLVALSEARKTIPLLMNLDKEYEGRLHLHDDLQENEIKKAFAKFEGEITQLPPVRSRVARKPRIRNIYCLKFLGKEKRDVSFYVHCQHGTYVRKLVHDIGESIGCGAHMTSLRRTGIGDFSVREAKPLEKISKKDIMPIEDVMKRAGVKSVWIKDNFLEKVRNGNPLYHYMIQRHDEIQAGERIGIFCGKRLVAVGLVLIDSMKWKKKKPLVKTDRVLKD